MPVAGAIVGGSVISGLLGADAATDAARIQANAAGDASQVARQTALDQIGAQAYATAPGRNVGTVALYQLASMLGIDPRTAFPQTQSGPNPDGPGMPNGDAAMSADSMGGWAGVGQGMTQRPQAAGGGGFDYRSLIGEMPMPGAPGAEFGSLNRAPTLSELQMDPSYGFRLNQNLGAIENSAAARGMQLSGSTLKDLSRFSQDFASQEYGNAYGRFMGQQNNQFNRLASLAGIGQTASQATGATAANAFGNAGNQIGQNIMGAGNAMAAGQIGQANAIGGALNNIGNFAFMQSLFNAPGGGAAPVAPTGGALDFAGGGF